MNVITDFGDMDWAEVIDLICTKCNLTTDLIVCKIEKRRWYNADYYNITPKEELYEYLSQLVQCEDCKNGCELREDNGEVYFTIVGSNRYDSETDEFIATDIVNVKFRNYIWR